MKFPETSTLLAAYDLHNLVVVPLQPNCLQRSERPALPHSGLCHRCGSQVSALKRKA